MTAAREACSAGASPFTSTAAARGQLMGRCEALMESFQVLASLKLIGERNPVLIELHVTAAVTGAE